MGHIMRHSYNRNDSVKSKDSGSLGGQIPIRSKPFFTEVQTELLGISVEHQFGPQRVRTGVHHPKVFGKIQRNFVGLLIAAYQSNDYGLRFAATSLGQVGKQR